MVLSLFWPSYSRLLLFTVFKYLSRLASSRLFALKKTEMPFLNCFSALRSRPNIALSHWSASLKGETRASLVPVKEEANCAFQPFSVSLYNKEILAV
ncbi:Uncharacterised protein [Segatella copri]|nr:Uncharacterised protein [Segatella copri]